MLKIGEFAQLSQVTVKTLHHYSDIGLFEPAHIDPQNNYRYYTVDQLAHIHRIMALKEVGLSLEQIGRLLNEDPSIDQFRGMLRLKQSEIEQEIQKAAQRLSMVEFRLRMIEAEVNFPNMDVVLKELQPLFVLSMMVKKHHTMKDVAQALQNAIQQGWVKYIGIQLDVFYGETIIPLESPELEEGQHEILIVVDPSQEDVNIPGLGELKTREEPGLALAATLMLDGRDRERSFEQVALLQRWAVAHGYGLRSQVRYLMHRGPLDTLNREEFVVEVQIPLNEDN